MSIKRQASLGGLELISGADQKEDSLNGRGIIHCVNEKIDRPGWAWTNQATFGGPGLISILHHMGASLGGAGKPMVSIKRQASRGGPGLISGVKQKAGFPGLT